LVIDKLMSRQCLTFFQSVTLGHWWYIAWQVTLTVAIDFCRRRDIVWQARNWLSIMFF
jgi:hypothetical protein